MYSKAFNFSQSSNPVGICGGSGGKGGEGAQTSLGAQTVKNPPAVQETRVRSLGWEDPLEEGRVAHSSVLAGESHGQRSLEGCSPWGRKESDTAEQLTDTFHFHEGA